MSVEIIHVNQGAHLSVQQQDGVLTVGGAALDLNALQQDWPQTLNYQLQNGALVPWQEGAWRVAALRLPPNEYHLVQEGEDPVTGDPVNNRQRLPVSTSRVTLHLWALPQTA